jgi:hypothetical protein
MVFETALERGFDDLVVTVILAVILKCTFPCVAILQFGVRNDFRHALRKWNGIASRHKENEKGTDRINLQTSEDANLLRVQFS